MIERRPPFQKEHPELSFGDVTKQLTAVWQSLDEHTRKKFDEIAAKDRERYQKEKEAFDSAKKLS